MELSTNGSEPNLTDASGHNATANLMPPDQSVAPYFEENVLIPGTTYIFLGLSCFIIIIGVFGNVSILIVEYKYRHQSKGHDVLVTALAVLNLLALVVIPFVQPSLTAVVGFDVRATSTWGCKLYNGALQSVVNTSSLVVLLICIQRFLLVWFPLRYRALLSPKTVRNCVLVCLTPVVLASAITAVLYPEIDENGFCNPNLDGRQYNTVLQEMSDTTVYKIVFGLPPVATAVILPVLTPLIIIKLVKQAAARRNLTVQDNDTAEFQASVKLTSIVVAYMALVMLPVGTVSAGFVFMKRGAVVVDSIVLAAIANYSLNFLLYSIFERNFRERAFGLFCFKNGNDTV